MVRQYIGARYVPKFYENSQGTSEWRSGVIYEPLTIVTWNGNSYTSKKTVPATVGDPSSNPSYWVATGIFNQQVEEIRQEVVALDGRMDDAEADIEILKRESGNYPHWIFVGDSYNDPQYSDWGNSMASALGLASADYDSLYVDGGSFYSGAMLNLVTGYVGTHTVDELAQVGNVVLMGGINDANQNITDWDADLGAKIQAYCTYCKTNFPNARILIGFCGNSVETSSILNGRTCWRVLKAIEQYQKCVDYGAEYLANVEYVLHDYGLFSADGIHPTVAGGAEIARAAIAAIRKGYKMTRSHYYSDAAGIASSFYDITHNIDSALSAVSILAPGGSAAYNVSVVQDGSVTNVNFCARLALLTATGSPVSLNMGKVFNIGLLADTLWNGKPLLTIPVSGSARHSDDNTKFTDVCGWITVNGGVVTFTVDRLDDRWTGSPVSADQILIKPWSVSGPTLLF